MDSCDSSNLDGDQEPSPGEMNTNLLCYPMQPSGDRDELLLPHAESSLSTNAEMSPLICTDQEVAIVDDDIAMCTALSHLLESVGYRVTTFINASEFLVHFQSHRPSCVLIDLMMPGVSGLMLCQRLRAIANLTSAFVIISGNVEVSTAVEAMKLGAIDLLEKPFGRQRVCDVVSRAMAKARYLRKRVAELQDAKDRLAKLTPREHEILVAMSDGKVTKEIARHCGISGRTVDVHRSRIMEKLKLASPTQLAHIISILHGEQQKWGLESN